jgi:hypothetical protein
VVEEHKDFVSKLDKLEPLVKDLEEGGTIDALLATWIDYEDNMKPHLLYEEEQGLPLMRAYFTPQEIVPIVTELVKVSPKHEMGALCYWNDPEYMRNEWMPQEGIPFFVWYIDFQFKFKEYKEVFVKNVNAVKEGVEPPAPLMGTPSVRNEAPRTILFGRFIGS